MIQGTASRRPWSQIWHPLRVPVRPSGRGAGRGEGCIIASRTPKEHRVSTWGLNVIKVDGKEFLLTGGNGESVHLTREARSDEAGRTPFHDWLLDPKRAEGRALRERYALTTLLGPRWADTTLCERQWISMETDWDECSVGDSEDVSSATCR
jgi:hypothetical protein